MEVFTKEGLKKLHKPAWDSSGEDNGSVTIIGGSSLFHGAPILALKAASRVVDMVFFASPEPSISRVAERLKAELSSFIWVPWEEVDAYIEKSDAVLTGPGMMRFTHEQKKLKNEEMKNVKKSVDGQLTRDVTKRLLTKFPHKKWVIDAGSLQTMEADWIPEKAILTPNRKEMEILFDKVILRQSQDDKTDSEILSVLSNVEMIAKKYGCIIVAKGVETIVSSPTQSMIVKGGNPGLTKGGSGDVLAGLTVALLAKNDPFLAACAASYIVKAAADELYKKVGVMYNADDLTYKIPEVIGKLLSNPKV